MKRYAIAATIALTVIVGLTVLEWWVYRGLEELLRSGQELTQNDRLMIQSAFFWNRFRWFLIPVIFAIFVGGTLAYNIFRKQD